MIKREDYHLLMTVLLDAAAEAGSVEEFTARIYQTIITSYEINHPDHGRVEVIDLAPFVKEAMGQHWSEFAAIGVENVEIVQFYMFDQLVLEAGRMMGKGRQDVAVDAIADMAEPVLRSFAKGMALGMRHHGVSILKRITGEEDEELSTVDDCLGLTSLIKQYLEEEVDETVAKFSAQLDALFGVAAAIAPDWSPPRGEVIHNEPPPR